MSNPPGRFWLLLACALGSAGCVASSPDHPGGTLPERVAPAPDSTRSASVDRDTVRRPSGRDGPVQALRAAYMEGAYDAVVRRIRSRRRHDSLRASETEELYVLLGRAEQARGRHAAAVDAFRVARRVAGDEKRSTVAIDRALGDSYAALYRWPEAASAFERVLDVRPDERAVRQALGEVYRRSRKWSEARAQYAQLVRADSSNGRWWMRLGQCNRELNHTERARRHFREAHRRVPRSAEVALSLSRLHRAEGHPEAARRVVDTTLTHQPGDSRLWRRRADLAFERDDLERARRAYVRTLATGDSSATVYRRIGLVDVRRQQYAQALPFLRRSLRRDSSHARTTLYLGVTYLRLDSLQQAGAYLQNTKALEHQGAVYSRRGKVSAALEAYKTALRLRPGRAELYFRLATVYDEHYRDKVPAARYYRRFLRANEGALPELRRYATSRLEALRTALHMQQRPSASSE
ncbi:tetratricopeptide repeat protein [Salinibacter altiplanensis]|uniref:tetratricopeptide repeat protein n=1 Tax=Salinibacter altiplanensis TaxID=1803181 RepID=UPI000C9FF53D|nr:tetratricopeptide repeat protein [Salinibacter altiplanensis]